MPHIARRWSYVGAIERPGIIAGWNAYRELCPQGISRVRLEVYVYLQVSDAE